MKKVSIVFGLMLPWSLAFGAQLFEPKFKSLTLSAVPQIKGNKCVPLSVNEVMETMIAYDEYQKIDGEWKEGEFKGDLSASGTQLIDMMSSQVRWNESIDHLLEEKLGLEDMKEGLVKIGMQPGNLGKFYQNIYPRFMISCRSGWIKGKRGKSFKQTCELVPNDENFALGRFDLVLTGTEGCPNGEGGVYVEYVLDLSTIQEHVDVIKYAEQYVISRMALTTFAAKTTGKKPEDIAAMAVDTAFKPDTFFPDYFNFFYDRGMEWAKKRLAGTKKK